MLYAKRIFRICASLSVMALLCRQASLSLDVKQTRLGNTDSAATVGWALLKWKNSQPLFLYSACKTEIAVYAKDFIHLSFNFFSTPGQKLYGRNLPVLQNADPQVDSIALSGHYLVMVISGSVYTTYLKVTGGQLLKASGIESDVSQVQSASCCEEEEQEWCRQYNKHVVAFDDSKHSEVIYLSQDAGFTFRKLIFRETFYGALQNVQVLQSHSRVASVIRSGKYEKQAVTISTNYSEEPADFIAVPFSTIGHKFNVFPVPGSSSLFIWDNSTLFHSYNGGQTVQEIEFHGLAHQGVSLPESEKVIRVYTDSLGQFIIVTSEGNIFYGRESLKPRCILINPEGKSVASDAEVVLGALDSKVYILTPQQQEGTILMQRKEYHLQSLLQQHASQLAQCLIQGVSSNYNKKTFYMDIGEKLDLHTTLISQPWTDIGFMIGVTNPDIAKISTKITDEGPVSKGANQYHWQSEISYKSKGSFSVKSKDFTSQTSVKLISAKGEILDCLKEVQQVAHVVVGCPPGKHIRVRKTTLVDECDVFKNYTYTIPSMMYDPSYMAGSGGNITWQDKTVTYDYPKYGCPISIHKSQEFKPILDVYIGDKFVGPLKGDYIIYEMNGVHEYSYNTTVEQAGCKGKSQSWLFMLQAQPTNQQHPKLAWTKHNYKCCNSSDTGEEDILPDDVYEVLSYDSYNAIVWGRKAGVFMFEAIVVDPMSSFCDLHVKFAVYVEGGTMVSGIPEMFVSGSTVGAGLVALYVGFLVLVQSKKAKVKKLAKQKQLQQMDLSRFKAHLPKGAHLGPIKKKKV